MFIALVDDRRIRVSATENHGIFNTTNSANNLIEDAVVPELVYVCKITVLFLRMKRFIDRSVWAYFSAHPVYCRRNIELSRL